MTSKRSGMYLVTTKHRGVFVGRVVKDSSPDKIELADARCVIYWSVGTSGFLGLASSGPAAGSRIGPAATRLTLYDVTAVAPLTAQAVEGFAKTEPYRG